MSGEGLAGTHAAREQGGVPRRSPGLSVALRFPVIFNHPEYSSSRGLAAASACLQLLRKGDHVVAGRDLYGGIYRLFTKVYRKFGLEFTFADLTDPADLEKALRPATKQLWLETPSNPLLRITDIAAASARARERGALVVADNTFATPYLQKPLDLGADIVLHSTTKHLNGHSDVIGGLLATRDPDLAAELRFYQNAVGAVPGPQDCFLTLRGIKTLGVRMDRHCRNAAAFRASNRVIALSYPENSLSSSLPFCGACRKSPRQQRGWARRR